MKQLISLFNEVTGKTKPTVEALPSSGSNRRYYRLTSGELSLIGVHGESSHENRAFIKLARHFHEKGLNVPEVLAVTDDEMFYLQQDLGDTILFDSIKGGRLTGIFSHDEKKWLHDTIKLLADFQVRGAEGLDFSNCYPLAEFDKRSIHWDLNYFKYNFLKTTGMDFREDLLENDFEKLSDDLLQDQTDTFLYRDFQSRNVMLVDNVPYFIDFQGDEKGLCTMMWPLSYGRRKRTFRMICVKN